MTDGTHDVVVWVGTKPGETRLFTITARNSHANTARLLEVEVQVAAADFVEHYRVAGLNKQQANKKKAELTAEYKKNGYNYQPRKSLPHPMKS